MMKRTCWITLCAASVFLGGCSGHSDKEKTETKAPPAPVYFKVDPATAGTVTGKILFKGRAPRSKLVDMSDDPACVEANHGRQYERTVEVNHNRTLANTFVYIKTGLEGKKFEPPATPVVIDQRGCWFRPRVLGIQVGQTLEVKNSDPVTHNIHPLAQINREWNHSQGQGEPPIERHFIRPEVMIRVKCNIHSWMHAYIGVVDNPYFAVTGSDGSFELRNVPPGNYTVEAWQEALGTKEQNITVPPSGKVEADFTFKGD